MRKKFLGRKVAMINQFKRFIVLILAGVCLNSLAVAQRQYYSWDFSDCELRDIFFAVSLDTGISIVPDDTVSGKGDLKFAGKDFYEAFDAFLSSNRLYVQRSEKVWTVSRFNSRKENGLFFVDACDLTPVQIVEKLSVVMGTVVTFDSLPGQKISIHFNGISEVDLMESLCKRFGNYEVVRNNVGYHFVKKSDVKRIELNDGFSFVEVTEKGFFFDLKNCIFEEVIEKLFQVEKLNFREKEFCLLSSGEVKIQRAVFFSVDFADALEKICCQSGFSFTNDNEIFYIFANSDSKSELVSGKRAWKKYSLNFTKSQEFFQLLYKRIGKIETVELTDKFSFLGYVNEKEDGVINHLIEIADISQKSHLITLKYLKPSELFEHLPPSVDRTGLFIADDMQSVYFKGTERAYENLLTELELCDRPVIRISYDLLILQYDETKQDNWSVNFEGKRLTANSRNNISAVLGSVMGFNMNVISAFGLNFAFDLQNSIEENSTRVFADTTLHGISGKQISFQNTNTYRYRDNNVNPETGIPIYTGITREISSGIRLEVLGWVSGDGMVTSKVVASVSRQGTDTSAKNGNPPPTSEKIITTEVCGKSGEPVILSGLVLSADSNQQKRTPLISKIPVLGNLFKGRTDIKEKSQMVIYLVPHIEGETNFEEMEFDECWVQRRIERIESLLNKSVEEKNE